MGKNLFTFLIVFCIIQLKYTFALTTITVTSSADDGSIGTFREALAFATSNNQDTEIKFNLSTPHLDVASEFYIRNVNGYSITIDGLTGLNQDEKLEIEPLTHGTFTNGVFRLVSSNITVKNIHFLSCSKEVIRVESFGVNATVDDCLIENNTSIAIVVKGENATVKNTKILNSSNGIKIQKSGFHFGSGNVITGTNEAFSEGIEIVGNLTGHTIGDGTGIVDNYSYIGGFYYGISSASPISVSDLLIGGKASLLEDCGNTTDVDYSVDYGIRLSGGNDTIFSEIGNSLGEPSVKISNVSEYAIQLFFARNININNCYLGIDFRWCNGDTPSGYVLSERAISSEVSKNVSVGNKKGCAIGNTKQGIFVRGIGSVDFSVENTYFGTTATEKNYAIYGDCINTDQSPEDISIVGNNFASIVTPNGATFSSKYLNLDGVSNVQVKNNFFAVKRTEESSYASTAVDQISIVSSESILIQENFFGESARSVSISNSDTIILQSNVFDAYYNKTPLPDQTSKLCVYLTGVCHGIMIGTVGRGNEFIGVNAGGVTAFGNNNDFSTINVHSNLFNKSTGHAIRINSGVYGFIGAVDDIESKNIILDAQVGILANGTAVLNAYNNTIGEEGTVNTGIFFQNSTSSTPSIVKRNKFGDTWIRCTSSNSITISENIFNKAFPIYLHNNSNFINGSLPISPNISGNLISSYQYELSGNSYSNAVIELFRKKQSTVGPYEFVASVATDGSGDWSYVDNLLGHDESDGYYAFVTKDNKTSQIGSLHAFCTKDDPNNSSSCVLLNDVKTFVHVREGEQNSKLFEADHKRLGIMADASNLDENPIFRLLDDHENLLNQASLFPVADNLFVLDFSQTFIDVSNVNYLTFELEDSTGEITKYHIGI